MNLKKKLTNYLNKKRALIPKRFKSSFFDALN